MLKKARRTCTSSLFSPKCWGEKHMSLAPFLVSACPQFVSVDDVTGGRKEGQGSKKAAAEGEKASVRR